LGLVGLEVLNVQVGHWELAVNKLKDFKENALLPINSTIRKTFKANMAFSILWRSGD